jgi:hypothetical protein
MRGFLILSSILTALMVWLFVAAPARADTTVDALTRVEWQGTPCIAYFAASNADKGVVGYPTFDCITGTPGKPRWAEWEQTRSTGQLIGIDPVMDRNTWMRCTVWINARIVVTDFALASDKREVSCLRTVS